MKINKLYMIVGVVVMLSMIMTGCGPATTTVASATSVPQTTVPPTAVPPTAIPPTTVPFVPISLATKDCSYGGEFKSVEAVDQYTVKFTLCYPDPTFLDKVASPIFAVYSSEYLKQTGGTGDLLDKPIGTGPYMLKEWDKGNQMVFVQNPNYWGTPAKNATLVFRWSSEAAQRLLELQSGDVDGIDNIGSSDFTTVKNDPTLQLEIRPALNVFYVGMNNTFAPFDNEQVRQAVAMGIDRQRLVDNFFPPGSEVADSFTPCVVPNGCAGNPWYTFDPVKAKALLAAAGYPNGFDTTITYRDVVRPYLPQPGVVAQDLQAQLKKNLNINAKIVVMESGTYLDSLYASKIGGLHLLGWTGDYPDVTNFLDFHFGVSGSAQFGKHFQDITDALTAGAKLADDAAREPFYVTANNAILQHVPMIPIAHSGSGVAYKATVQNPIVSPTQNEAFAATYIQGQDTFVWMQNGEPLSMFCGDETDGDTARACLQVMESLYRYKSGGTTVEPALATSCDPNTDLTEWTCQLRKNVTFSNGDPLDANDVTQSFIMQWDDSSPLHVGRTGAFDYFSSLFGGFLNVPQPTPTP